MSPRDALLADVLHALGAQQSTRLLRDAVGRIPEDVVRATLSEVLMMQREGRIRTSAVACFSDRIKRAAAEHGVSLQTSHYGQRTG